MEGAKPSKTAMGKDLEVSEATGLLPFALEIVGPVELKAILLLPWR